MPSRAESIMQAVMHCLTSPAMTSVPADQVYRDITRAIDSAKTVAIAVEEGDETAPDKSLLGIAYRRLEVRVAALAKGQAATTLADAPMLESFNRIMADRSLGGLVIDIEEGETTRQREALEKEVAVFTKTYFITYRTGEGSLEI